MENILCHLPTDIVKIIQNYLPSKYNDILSSNEFKSKIEISMKSRHFGPAVPGIKFGIDIPIKYVEFDWEELWSNEIGCRCDIIPNKIRIGNNITFTPSLCMEYRCPKCDNPSIRKILENEIIYNSVITYPVRFFKFQRRSCWTYGHMKVTII